MKLRSTPAAFGDMRDAIDALSAFEASTVEFFNYELINVVDHGREVVVGVQVRVCRDDGTPRGYLQP